jgi:hypothetical protein
MRENQMVKYQPKPNIDAFLFAMYLMYCRAPGSKTAPGQIVNLGEIGAVPERTFDRWCPYSPATAKPQGQPPKAES